MRVELGCPGHFIGSANCHWKRNTEVFGRYRISTVGDYYPPGEDGRQRIGAGKDSFFETMVFELDDEGADGSEGCECHEVKSWTEIDGRRYATAGEAQRGHEEMVEQYMSLVSTEIQSETREEE